jgi:RNA ligase (TIGR02306 family)
MSNHNVPIIEIKSIKIHPNADKLEIIEIQGWQTCVRKGDFKIGDKAIWVEPDYTVPTDRPEFAFLKPLAKKDGKVRIKVKKLRGELSQGLLIPLPPAFLDKQVDTNVIDDLDIKRWEPDINFGTGGNSISGPPGMYVVKYDVDNFNSFRDKALPYLVGQKVVVQEKLNGANCRFVFCSTDQTFYIGSRTQWKPLDGDSLWNKLCEQYPQIEEWCRKYPDYILCGEVFGTVGGMKYGARPGQLFFAAFDIMYGGKWLKWTDFLLMITSFNGLSSPEWCSISIAPVLYEGLFDEEHFRELAERESEWDSCLHSPHLSEGIVFKTFDEVEIPYVGRPQFKMVSNRYLQGD